MCEGVCVCVGVCGRVVCVGVCVGVWCVCGVGGRGGAQARAATLPDYATHFWFVTAPEALIMSRMAAGEVAFEAEATINSATVESENPSTSCSSSATHCFKLIVENPNQRCSGTGRARKAGMERKEARKEGVEERKG